jgi:transposase
MNLASISAVEEHLPNAAIAFDRYHISAFMSQGIKDLRRKFQSRVNDKGKKPFSGSRFLSP